MSSADLRRALIALCLVAAVVAPVPSGAAARAYAVSRGAAQTGSSHELVTPNLVLPQGTELVFVNLHLWGHNITSDDWLTPSVRLFRSEMISFGEQALVEGVERLDPGTYGFFCRNHIGMRGSITII